MAVQVAGFPSELIEKGGDPQKEEAETGLSSIEQQPKSSAARISHGIDRAQAKKLLFSWLGSGSADMTTPMDLPKRPDIPIDSCLEISLGH